MSDKDVSVFLKNAYNAFNDKDYKAAIDYFSEAIKLDPSSAETYYNRGNAKANLDDKSSYKSAIEDYSWAINLNDKFAAAYYNRGILNRSLGNSKEAIEDFNKAIELNYNLEEAYYVRGNTKASLKDYKGSIEDYNKAVEVYPHFSDAYYNMALSHNAVGSYKEAIKAYDPSYNVTFTSTTGYPATTPLSRASLHPFSTAGIYSLGITPPVILLTNSNSFPGFGSRIILTCPYCPLPPDCFAYLTSWSVVPSIVSL